jgi:hypothetical protein
MLGKFHPPSYLGRWSIVMGSLKIDACHMYHLPVEVSCWACIRVGNIICAMNQIFAIRYIVKYCILCSKHSVLANDFLAWARTSDDSRPAVSSGECDVGVKSDP